MKKMGWICLIALLLSGCGTQPTMETVSDEVLLTAMAIPRSVCLQLPEEASVPVLQSDTQQIYQCEDFDVIVEKVEAGNLGKTVKAISGFEADKLTLLKTRQGEVDRCDFVWACMGETGERLGRAAILDDGSYHYCLWVLRDADAGDRDWDAVFASFCLAEDFIRTD